MKRIALISLLSFLALTSAYSAPLYNDIMGRSFRPQSLRFSAMGESGIAIPKREEAFFINPAGLADDRSFYLSLPSINLSLYQVKDIFTSPLASAFKGDIDSILEIAGLLNGNSPLLYSDQSIKTSFSGFGASMDIEEVLYSTGQSFGSGFIPAIKSSLSLGYGHSWELNEDYNLSLGFMEHVTGMWYSTEISAESVVDLLKGDPSALSLISSGWNLSTDIGAILSMPLGFSFGISFNDIGSGTTLVNQSTGESERIYSDSLISLGFAWEHTFKGNIRIAFASDFIDLIDYFSQPTFANLLYHMNLGAELNLSKWVSLYTGLNGGYPSFGLEVQLLWLRLGALYRYQESGYEVGLNPKDQLEISLALVF